MDNFIIAYRLEEFILRARRTAIPFKEWAYDRFPLKLFFLDLQEVIVLVESVVLKHIIQLVGISWIDEEEDV